MGEGKEELKEVAKARCMGRGDADARALGLDEYWAWVRISHVTAKKGYVSYTAPSTLKTAQLHNQSLS